MTRRRLVAAVVVLAAVIVAVALLLVHPHAEVGRVRVTDPGPLTSVSQT